MSVKEANKQTDKQTNKKLIYAKLNAPSSKKTGSFDFTVNSCLRTRAKPKALVKSLT